MEISDNALEVLSKRYFMEGEVWETCCRRVGSVIAQYENEYNKWTEAFSECIYNGDFIPGGRIMRNAGRARGSLFNCYLIPIGDSIEAIGTCNDHAWRLWSDGGGVGINFSPLRPKGASIKGKGGCSSGLVSFMRAINACAQTIESGGQRRAAAISIVDIRHPEVEDFIDAKLVHGELSCFNISVSVVPEFLEAVENDTYWNYEFEGKNYGRVEARKLWSKIVDNMITSAEPGLLNWTNLQKNNSYYFSPILGTNPCGEVPLGAYEACNLGSITLSHFLSGKNTNWIKLGNVIDTAVRFLDNVIDSNKYTLTQIEQNEKAARRIGIGTMGLADYLFAKGIRYGSEESITEIERLYKFIRNKVYESSIKLGIEKGNFSAFEKVPYSKASFIRKLPASLRMDIKKYGIRNCTCIAQAPTGTISLIPEVSSGIEPLYAKAYKTNDKVGERYYIHPKYKEVLETGSQTPEWLVDSYDTTPQEHFEVQVAVQKFTDGATSKTINMPRGSTSEELSRLLLEYIWDLKGCTVYVDGCRGEQPLEKITEEEAKEHISRANVSMDKESVSCHSGKCEL